MLETQRPLATNDQCGTIVATVIMLQSHYGACLPPKNSNIHCSFSSFGLLKSKYVDINMMEIESVSSSTTSYINIVNKEVKDANNLLAE